MKENKAQRHSIRLRGYDYSRVGSYFVTACVQNRECLFGQIYHELPKHFQNIELDTFVIMPNHIHSIIHTLSSEVQPPKLGNIVGTFKSISAIKINRELGRQGHPLWQRNYYERIIRNENEYLRIKEYIENNPLKWEEDSENPLKSR